MPRHTVVHVATHPASGIPDARLSRTGHLDASGAGATAFTLFDDAKKKYSMFLGAGRALEDFLAQHRGDHGMLCRSYQSELVGFKLQVNKEL